MKIRELSEQLANQIAAGEVVERPASVVKELVENALDAGSTQIDILLEDAGLKKIQVVDNGEGIASEDVENAFKRHATSKIHHQADLFRIRTLGFRGEALPSIASVSEMTIETATKDESNGTIVHLQGGKILSHQMGPLRKGTKVVVENLFFNTPARLKYIKTFQTELANVGDIVNRLALSHPAVAFRLVHDGNPMTHTAGTGDLKQTIAGIYGIQTAKKMLAIQASDLDFELKGYLSLPEVTRANRNYLSLIINGRYIKNYALNKAIVQGYGSKLMIGRYPIAIIEITMDPLLVDVNVHPTKQEVRLSKEPELMQLIRTTIAEALKEETLIPNVGQQKEFNERFKTNQKPEQIKLPLSNAEIQQPLAYDASSGEFFVPHKQSAEKLEPTWQGEQLDTQLEEENGQQSTDKLNAFLSEKKITQTNQVGEDQLPFETSVSHEATEVSPQMIEAMLEEKPSTQRFPELEYFGQMHGTFLFAQGEDGLYIIDQHAAQERIKYEYYREKIGEVSHDSQALLIPIVLEYPTDDYLRIMEGKDTLQQVGIGLEEFGHATFIIRTHPTWFPVGQEEQTVKDLIDMYLTTGKVSVKKFLEGTAIMMSCKRSIKANHYLDDKQARMLLKELATCENPFNCPHGRPVLIHFTLGDMERMFKRIQDPHQTRE
ncbi:DNA mismatch repair endonuclease MutL [Enterococcus camelliae]|uniref:DNA mismatch repair protein MutL n=1 Tax=Enterococcus camelliae TaxID=453959 RepID=A0ABW5TK47_9ENTE